MWNSSALSPELQSLHMSLLSIVNWHLIDKTVDHAEVFVKCVYGGVGVTQPKPHWIYTGVLRWVRLGWQRQ